MRSALPLAMRKRGAALLHQQCWFWGKDVRHTGGNVLLQQGFVRVRPPNGISGCSQYTLVLPMGKQVRLWGFGLYFGGDTGIYLNRFAFAPRTARLTEDVWDARALESLPFAGDLSCLAAALEWIAEAERQTQQKHGSAYRQQCLAGWQKRVVSPTELVTGWLRLAEEVRTLCPLGVTLSLGQPSHRR